MSTVIFRADANHNVGMGHVMRTLSIANAFVSAGNSVRFVLADDTVREFVESKGYETAVFHSDYRHMDDELTYWLQQDLTADYLIVDSYYVTESYLSSLKQWVNKAGGKLVYIDDVLSFPYPADILIDYGVYASISDYKNLYNNSKVEEPKFILGASYTPLREMFRGIEYRSQPETVHNILITTGGSDELHIALAILRCLLDDYSLNKDERTARVYHFLLGSMNTDKVEIERVASNVEWMRIHENVSDMRSLIQSMDLVISAAGSTLYEIAACGVPLITYSLADNQIPGGEAFQRLGLAEYIGDLREPDSIAMPLN